MFTSGCIILNSEYAEKDQKGYYVYHYYSCGPRALEKIILGFEGKSPNAREISKEIQDSGNSMRLCAALVHCKAIQATWPSEIKKVLVKRGYEVKEVNSLSELEENDKAVVLVRGSLTQKEYYHWLAHPIDKNIDKFFGEDTKVLLVIKVK